MGKKSRVDKVWEKGSPMRGKTPNLHRRDSLGNKMYKSSYGKDSEQGWQIDHKRPKSKGGSDSLRNLQPLNSHANRSKGNKYP